MQIKVSAQAIAPIIVMSAFEGSLPPKKDFENPDLQQTDVDTGKAVFSGKGLQVLKIVDNQPKGIDNSVTVNLLSPTTVTFGRNYRLKGNLRIVHYAGRSGFVNCTIFADALEEITPGERQ